MKAYRTFITIAVFIFAGCHSDPVIELPDVPSKLTLNCVGQEGRVFNCNVNISKGILEFLPFDAESNATIHLFENGVLVDTLNKDPFDASLYFSDVSPVPGEAYNITVFAQGFESVESSYVQPFPVEVRDLKVTKVGSSKILSNGSSILINVEINDRTGHNFYAMTAKRKTEDSDFPVGAASLGLSFVDPAYNENKEVFNDMIVFDDSFFDGTNIVLNFSSDISNDVFGDPMNYYSVYLMSLTEDYFNYLKTSSLQQLTRNDPFAQPVIIKSNIKNGLGIFGGFTPSQKTVYNEIK